MSDNQDHKKVDNHLLQESTDSDIPPGEILLTEFMEPCGLSIEDLANLLHVSQETLCPIIANDPWPITVELALRLGRLFGMSPEFWLNLQRSYELRKAFKNSELIKKIEREVPAWPAANWSNARERQ